MVLIGSLRSETRFRFCDHCGLNSRSRLFSFWRLDGFLSFLGNFPLVSSGRHSCLFSSAIKSLLRLPLIEMTSCFSPRSGRLAFLPDDPPSMAPFLFSQIASPPFLSLFFLLSRPPVALPSSTASFFSYFFPHPSQCLFQFSSRL